MCISAGGITTAVEIKIQKGKNYIEFSDSEFEDDLSKKWIIRDPEAVLALTHKPIKIPDISEKLVTELKKYKNIVPAEAKKYYEDVITNSKQEYFSIYDKI